MIVDIVLGCTFGDEGKGKVVYDLLKKNHYDLSIRFNGGPNAGHTIYMNDDKVIVHQLPVGILIPNTINLISSDCIVNIEKLKEEIQIVTSKGISIENRLLISKGCHIITQEAIDFDRSNNKIGTTGSGIGPTYSQKMLRVGKRVEDYQEEFIQMGFQIVDMRQFWSQYSHIQSVLLEGAQGFELDINWTNHYPYCTSSTCTLAGAINTGIQIKHIRNVYGVAKIYDTYVGTMEFQPSDDNDLILLGDVGKEYGSTTGRRRQCNYLNIDQLKLSLFINNCNICIINKVDIAEICQIFKCYYQNQLITFPNSYEMKQFIQQQLPDVHIIFSSNPYSIET